MRASEFPLALRSFHVECELQRFYPAVCAVLMTAGAFWLPTACMTDRPYGMELSAAFRKLFVTLYLNTVPHSAHAITQIVP